MRRGFLPFACVALLGCQAAPQLGLAAPTARPLPARVTGANLSPVGDARRGYGTPTSRRTIERLKGLGVNTISILMEGRMRDLRDAEVRLPSSREEDALRSALLDAHALGLATILIPQLYVDDGAWRGDIRLEEARLAEAWWPSYQAFIEVAARVAASSGASALAIGVELKGLSATDEGSRRMRALAAEARREFKGTLTYAANWDEAEAVRFWDAVDIAGVNGYYPLVPDPVRGAETVGRRLTALAERADRDVLVLEVGYRSSPLSHVRPWEWPKDVGAEVDDAAQASAWAAVLASWLPLTGVRGLLVWVIPTDPDDPASEPRHGFNPLNKPAEAVIGRAFRDVHDAKRSAPGVARSRTR